MGPENLYFHEFLEDTGQRNNFKNYSFGSWEAGSVGKFRSEFRSPRPTKKTEFQNLNDEIQGETGRFLEAWEHWILSSDLQMHLCTHMLTERLVKV